MGRLSQVARACVLVAAAASLFSGPLVAAPKGVERCIGNLRTENLKERAVRTYCRCMAKILEDQEMAAMRQTEMERSYPPVHARCYKKAGWR